MGNVNKILVALAVALSAAVGSGQVVTEFGGEKNAIQFAYGIPGVASPALQVSTGNTATGSSTITLVSGASVQSNGQVSYPLNINAPITVGIGANSETVTPTAISGCNLPSTQVYQCQITASFSNLHGAQEPVTSGTYGLQEAINRANSQGGGVVLVDVTWQNIGGTTAIITAAASFPKVSIRDTRGSGNPWWTMQPTTLTSIATPATLTSTTVVFTAAPVGTWGTSAYYFCVTYIDALGGESPCSASYTQTPGTTAYSLNITSPPASTGAVGWRAYGGVSSTALAYLLPVTSTSCTLTTLESVMPACAIGSAGLWPALYLTTGDLSPVALGVTNVNNPVPQGHTTFGYQPSGSPGTVFQTNYGPFGTGAIASATAADVTILGSVNLPTGYLNTIGRTVRFSGKIKLTAGASSTLSIQTGMVWAAGVVAGLPTTVCNSVSGVVFATQPYTDVNFTCTMTTNAVGATAVGTIQPESNFLASYAAGTVVPVAADTSAVAITALGLFSQDTISFWVVPSVAADTTVQLMSLHVETLQ